MSEKQPSQWAYTLWLTQPQQRSVRIGYTNSLHEAWTDINKPETPAERPLKPSDLWPQK